MHTRRSRAGSRDVQHSRRPRATGPGGSRAHAPRSRPPHRARSGPPDPPPRTPPASPPARARRRTVPAPRPMRRARGPHARPRSLHWARRLAWAHHSTDPRAPRVDMPRSRIRTTRTERARANGSAALVHELRPRSEDRDPTQGPALPLRPTSESADSVADAAAPDETEVPAGAGSTGSSLVLLYWSKRLAATGSVENQHSEPELLRFVHPDSDRGRRACARLAVTADVSDCAASAKR